MSLFEMLAAFVAPVLAIAALGLIAPWVEQHLPDLAAP